LIVKLDNLSNVITQIQVPAIYNLFAGQEEMFVFGGRYLGVKVPGPAEMAMKDKIV
jgi:hypothetical protein